MEDLDARFELLRDHLVRAGIEVGLHLPHIAGAHDHVCGAGEGAYSRHDLLGLGGIGDGDHHHTRAFHVGLFQQMRMAGITYQGQQACSLGLLCPFRIRIDHHAPDARIDRRGSHVLPVQSEPDDHHMIVEDLLGGPLVLVLHLHQAVQSAPHWLRNERKEDAAHDPIGIFEHERCGPHAQDAHREEDLVMLLAEEFVLQSGDGQDETEFTELEEG